jgi:hypothetical protein
MNFIVCNHGNNLKRENKIKLPLAVTKCVRNQTSDDGAGKTRTLGNDCVYEVWTDLCNQFTEE